MKTIPQPINNLNIKKKKKGILKLAAFFSIFFSNAKLSGHQLDQNTGDLAINTSISYILKKGVTSNKVF